ncbi:hypothetical protein PMI27_001243 [Pseudomonas sp. GM41(2012)]|jgi:hypothetical protein|uniref:hypothetical protein n=1 Tax=Pseudomonas sp. (strain GM41(2012)) TaxID=1144708 RepID=UPI000270324E|nr:hypothetical protein [Pseudomonas sp. GM41(2012)]EUB75067.1 hypothetical protein PMI27_001243 [Pseudomonas sp. GM41(2012)]
MANAEIYTKWRDQQGGNRGSGWSGPHGSASASGAEGIVELNQHAERLAWKAAWPNAIRTFIRTSIKQFPNQPLQIKIWVDQQVCPSCQKWMVIDVISHLKLLKQEFPTLKVELYAEVLFARKTEKVRVQQSTVWPVTVGNQSTYQNLPEIYN